MTTIHVIIHVTIHVIIDVTFSLSSFCGVYGSTGGKRYDVRSSLQQFKDVMAEGDVM